VNGTGFSRATVEALSARRAEPTWMLERRLAAWDVYEQMPWPTLKDEDWRRTDIRALKAGDIHPYTPGPGGAQARSVIPADYLSELADAEQGGLLVQVNSDAGYRELKEELAEQGVIFADMDTALREHDDLLREHFMTRAVKPEQGKFAALHGALWQGGTFVYVPRGVALDLPLHSILYADQPGAGLFAHTLVVLAERAAVTVVHEVASPTLTGAQGLYAGATELHVGPAAQLKYVSLQSWGRHVFNFTHERARLERDANLDWIVGAMGSRLTKSYLELELDGQGASGRMSGLFFADREQHLDHDTQQNHNAPHTTSDLLFKGALRDRSRSVWQGMIRVAPGAQRTDGYQANRNLILSDGARADSIPGLEIMADDVRCTHGSTVGQIDEEHVFYLRSRGMTRREAERLIVEGFFLEVLDRIPFEGLRARLGSDIARKLGF
jgi:Fe-S cluster assembly protein SufD